MFFQEIPQVQVVERTQQQIVRTIEVPPHERVQKFTAEQSVHIPGPPTQEQSALTDLGNPKISITAVEVVNSFSVSEEVAINANSTSTSRDRLDELANMLDSCLEQLTPLASMGEETERIEMLTKRMMEILLPWKQDLPRMVDGEVPEAIGSPRPEDGRSRLLQLRAVAEVALPPPSLPKNVTPGGSRTKHCVGFWVVRVFLFNVAG